LLIACLVCSNCWARGPLPLMLAAKVVTKSLSGCGRPAPAASPPAGVTVAAPWPCLTLCIAQAHCTDFDCGGAPLSRGAGGGGGGEGGAGRGARIVHLAHLCPRGVLAGELVHQIGDALLSLREERVDARPDRVRDRVRNGIELALDEVAQDDVRLVDLVQVEQ